MMSVQRQDALDKLIGTIQGQCTPDDIDYLVRHLANPYYTEDGITQLGLRAVADAQRAADGNLVEKLATPRYPQTAATRECAHCTHVVPRTQGLMRKDQFFCLRCEKQQRQVA